MIHALQCQSDLDPKTKIQTEKAKHPFHGQKISVCCNPVIFYLSNKKEKKSKMRFHLLMILLNVLQSLNIHKIRLKKTDETIAYANNITGVINDYAGNY